MLAFSSDCIQCRASGTLCEKLGTAFDGIYIHAHTPHAHMLQALRECRKKRPSQKLARTNHLDLCVITVNAFLSFIVAAGHLQNTFEPIPIRHLNRNALKYSCRELLFLNNSIGVDDFQVYELFKQYFVYTKHTPAYVKAICGMTTLICVMDKCIQIKHEITVSFHVWVCVAFLFGSSLSQIVLSHINHIGVAFVSMDIYYYYLYDRQTDRQGQSMIYKNTSIFKLRSTVPCF